MRTVREAKTGTLFALVLLGIATSCGPAGATARNVPGAVTVERVFVPAGWDTRKDRNFDRNYDTSGFDRRFSRRNAVRGYDASGFDRLFDRNLSHKYDTNGIDRPPNHPFYPFYTPRKQ